jgi:mycofactocin precursor
MPDKTNVVEVEPEPPVVEVEEPIVEEDLLVEDVSIDGMCGVY